MAIFTWCLEEHSSSVMKATRSYTLASDECRVQIARARSRFFFDANRWLNRNLGPEGRHDCGCVGPSGLLLLKLFAIRFPLRHLICSSESGVCLFLGWADSGGVSGTITR